MFQFCAKHINRHRSSINGQRIGLIRARFACGVQQLLGQAVKCICHIIPFSLCIREVTTKTAYRKKELSHRGSLLCSDLFGFAQQLAHLAQNGQRVSDPMVAQLCYQIADDGRDGFKCCIARDPTCG